MIKGEIKEVLDILAKGGIKKNFIVYSSLLSIVVVAVSAYSVRLLFPLVQNIIQSDFEKVIKIGVLMYFLAIIRSSVMYFGSIALYKESRSAITKLRSLLFQKILDLDKKSFDRRKVASLHTLFMKSSHSIDVILKAFQDFLTESLLLVVYFFIMLYISWELALLSILVFPIVSFLSKSLIKKIRSVSDEDEEASLGLSDRILGVLYALPLVKSFVKEDEEMKNFDKANEEEMQKSFEIKKLKNLIRPIEDIGSTTGTLVLAIAVTILSHKSNIIDPVNLFIFFFISSRMVHSLNAINAFRVSVERAKIHIENMKEILSHNESDDHVADYGELKIDIMKKRFDGLRNSIAIKDLEFSFDNTKNILKKVNLNIQKGSIVAITGRSGSGKSTLINLLLGFYKPKSGDILIDGINLKDIDIKSFRNKISYVSQESFLFNSTVDHNILYGVDTNSSNTVDNAKKHEISMLAGAHDFIEKLPNKYNEKVKERGVNFSGGEKQRISIARALLKNHDILILDEATSSVDQETEGEIFDAIKKVSKGKTIIVVTHRKSVSDKADVVVRLKNGEIA